MELEERKGKITVALEGLVADRQSNLEQRLQELKELLEAEHESNKHKGAVYTFYQEESDRLGWWWPAKLRDELYTEDDLMKLNRLSIRMMAKACGISSRDSCSLDFEELVSAVLEHGMTYEVPAPRPRWGFDTEDVKELRDRFFDLPEWRDDDCRDDDGAVFNLDEIREEGIGIVVRLDSIAKKFGLDASVYLDRWIPDAPDYENPEQIIEAWWGGEWLKEEQE